MICSAWVGTKTMGSNVHRKLAVCTLRSMEQADVATIHGWMNNEEMQAKLEDQALSSDEIDAKLEQLVGCDPLADKQGGFVVDYDGRAIGFIHLMWINWISRTGEVDLMVNPELLRSMLAFNVLQKAGELAFEQLNLNKIYAYVFASNKDSIGLLKRVMRVEATQKAGRRPATGDEDVHVVSLFAEDYVKTLTRMRWPGYVPHKRKAQ